MSRRGGPPPTPIETRLREGDRSHRPIPQTVVLGGRLLPGDPLPPAPTTLSTDGRRVWRRLVQLLVAGGVYDRGDSEAVELAASLTVRLRQVRKELDDYQAVPRKLYAYQEEATRTLLVRSARGTTAHPLVAKEAELASQLRQALAECGLSAAGRTRLGKSGDRKSTLGAQRNGLRDPVAPTG